MSFIAKVFYRQDFYKSVHNSLVDSSYDLSPWVWPTVNQIFKITGKDESLNIFMIKDKE